MTEVIESLREQDTYDLGKKLGENCKPGDIILLNGDLGVGKTVFTKGFGKGLGIEEPISSPTFTIMQIYEVTDPLFKEYGKIIDSVDVYRIADPEEMDEIGYEDYFFGKGVCLIEWASLIEELIPEHVTEIQIEKVLEKGFDYRKITIVKR